MKKKIITVLTILLIASCGVSNKEIEGNKVIKSDGAYYLVYNTTVIKLTNDTYITKEKKVSDYFSSKFTNQEDDFLVDLKKYFPHGFNGIEEGTTPEMYIDMPVLTLGDKNIVDSYKLSLDLSNKNPELLITQDITKEDKTDIQDNTEINFGGKKIAVLNANGVAGYAKNMGEKLKSNLGIEYISENYTKSETFNYVVNHNLNDAEIEKLISTAGLKYVKILKDDNLKPEYDAVLITGNDSKVTFDIEILSKSGVEEISKVLNGFKVSVKKESNYNNEDIKDVTNIMYNSEDMYIAKLLKTLLTDANLIEDMTLKNKIVITTK